MSFSSILPKPKNLNSSKWSSNIQSSDSEDDLEREGSGSGLKLQNKNGSALKSASISSLKAGNSLVPVYGKRKDWIPMNQSSFRNGIVSGWYCLELRF